MIADDNESTRKVLKIRPGFTPVEDISRFRPTRALEADSTRGLIPGSSQGRSSANGGVDPYSRDNINPNPFKSDPSSTQGGKAQTKNAKRREKKRGDIKTGGSGPWGGENLDWDEDDQGVERVSEVDDVIGKLGAIDISGRSGGVGGAPKEGISTLSDRNTQYSGVTPYGGPSTPSNPSDPISNPPPISTSDTGGSSLISAERTERDWKAARPPTGGNNGSTRSERNGEGEGKKGEETESRADRGGRWVRGGAPPPVFSGRSRGGPPGSSPRSQQPESEVRVRKEVKIRGGTGGSLADRVKGLLADNGSTGRGKSGADGNGDWRSKP